MELPGGNPATHSHFRMSVILRYSSDRTHRIPRRHEKGGWQTGIGFRSLCQWQEGEPAQFGEQLGTILEEEIPAFMKALGEEVAASGRDFETWYTENPEKLKEIAAPYL